MFLRLKFSDESSIRASLRVAEILTKSGRPFTDGEIIKQCALVMAEEACLDQKINLKMCKSLYKNVYPAN